MLQLLFLQRSFQGLHLKKIAKVADHSARNLWKSAINV